MTKEKEMKEETQTTKRPRAERKKTYERVRESAIPNALIEFFKKDDWELKLIRYSLQGEEDYRYLNMREREGYELVSMSEIPENLRGGLEMINTKNRQGLIVIGDLVLMKVDSDLRNSRRKAFQQLTDNEVASVDVHVLEKRGFRNLGSSSKTTFHQPKFDS